MTKFLYALGSGVARRRWVVLAAWVAVAGSLLVLRGGLGGSPVDNFEVPGVESQAAGDLLEDRFPSQSGATATVVFFDEAGIGARRGEVADALAEVRALPHVSMVADPFSGVPSGGVSQDDTVAFTRVVYDRPVTELEAVDRERLLAVDDGDEGLQVEFGGELVQALEPRHTGISEAVGLVTAVLVLLFAFGSLVAMGLTMGTAMLGLATGLSSIVILSSVIDMPSVASRLATMIGLGVGIDYALFVVARYRQNVASGKSRVDAIASANATSGQSVVFAGGTVVIAILGLQLSGIPFVASLGYAAAIVVAVAVVAAVTLLPALLAIVGDRIESLRVRKQKPEPEDGGSWVRWARRVVAKPGRYLLASLAVLLLAAVPVLNMRLGYNDAGSKSRDDTQRRAYDLLSDGFGVGVNGPLLVVVDLGGNGDPTGMEDLATELRTTEGVAAVTPPVVNPAGDTAVMQVIPGSSPSSEATTDLVHSLRQDVLPSLTDDFDGRAYVGGPTASFIDQSDKISERLPWFMGAVVGMSFILLMIVFRSILVPLKAALLNLLSIGAAYGVVVAIFQWGWGLGLVGLEETIPVAAFVPMMMFAILFGLSMDYEVFLLSRIREEYLVTGSNSDSIVRGLGATARVITSAALIMISVFLSFVLNDDPIVKMMGVGLATAVLVDATIVRVVLVPATMALLGDANWWLPGWLARILPAVHLEGEGIPPRGTAPEAAR
ncbi:MAG TPA: MMPL family transporter [Actinomycetota bacterium]|nr:MMPL family transporter [Actinomycetota bacterium]